MKIKQDFDGDGIELKVCGDEVSIYDECNSYQCRFDLRYLDDMIKQFMDWGNCAREFDTRVLHSYGYRGNWIIPSRVKYMIEMLRGSLRFEKKSKSQLKRMAISSIQKDLAILKTLLESRT